MRRLINDPVADDRANGDHVDPRNPALLMGEENDRRVRQAETTLRAYQQITNSDDSDLLADLLGDLLHWCGRHYVDFFHALDTASWHHSEEVKEERMPPNELQQALRELSSFHDSKPHGQLDDNVPMLFNIATDEPFGDNRSDPHDPDCVYLAFLTTAGLEKLKADSGGRISYWPAGWYPEAEALLAECGSEQELCIWQKANE